MKLSHPLHFSPLLRPVVWGGKELYKIKQVPEQDQAIGESWEVSVQPEMVSTIDRGEFQGQKLDKVINENKEEFYGPGKILEAFPLLIKLIDARQNLSVQVHPDDELAWEQHHCKGKTEMWHVVSTSPGAKIYAGLKKTITPEEYDKMVEESTILDAVKAYDSQPGDTFFLAAGTLHAIGAGNLIAEIQQTSDITYRVYDYNRGRELHTSQARRAIKMNDTTECRREGNTVSCEYFHVRTIKVNDQATLTPMKGSFMILMALNGDVEIKYKNGQERLPQGDTLLFPASVAAEGIILKGEGTILAIE